MFVRFKQFIVEKKSITNFVFTNLIKFCMRKGPNSKITGNFYVNCIYNKWDGRENLWLEFVFEALKNETVCLESGDYVNDFKFVPLTKGICLPRRENGNFKQERSNFWEKPSHSTDSFSFSRKAKKKVKRNVKGRLSKVVMFRFVQHNDLFSCLWCSSLIWSVTDRHKLIN